MPPLTQQSLQDVLVGGGSGFLQFITQLIIAELQAELGREQLGFQREQAGQAGLFQLSNIFGNPRDVGRQASLIRQGAGTSLATAGAEGKSFVGPQFQQLIEAITNPQPRASISAAHGASFTLGAPHQLVNTLTGQVTAELEAGEAIKATPPKVEGQQAGAGQLATQQAAGGQVTGPGQGFNPFPPGTTIEDLFPGGLPGSQSPAPPPPTTKPPAAKPTQVPVVPDQIFTPQEFEGIWQNIVTSLQQPGTGLAQQLGMLSQLASAVPPEAQNEIARRLRELGRPELADALDNISLEALTGSGGRTLFQQTGQAPKSAANLEDFLALGFVPAPGRLTRDLLDSLSFEGRERLSGGASATGRSGQGFFEDVLKFHPRSPQRQFAIQFGRV